MFLQYLTYCIILLCSVYIIYLTTLRCCNHGNWITPNLSSIFRFIEMKITWVSYQRLPLMLSCFLQHKLEPWRKGIFFFFTLDHRSGDTGRGVCWRKGGPDKGRGVCWHWPGVHGSPGSKGCSAAAHSHGPWVSLFPTSSNARAIAFNKRVSNAQNLSEVPWEIVPLLCIPLEWSECPGCCCTGLQ